MRLSPRHATRHRVFPMATVEMTNRERGNIHIVQATHIHVDLIRIGTRNVKWMNAAHGAKSVLGDAGIESVGRQRILAAEELECIRRHDEMEKPFFAADRAIAFGHPRQIRGDAKAHAPTVATALIGLHQLASARERGRRSWNIHFPLLGCLYPRCNRLLNVL
jgi:hypothetical protein